MSVYVWKKRQRENRRIDALPKINKNKTLEEKVEGVVYVETFG